MRVAVVGITGLIGSALAQALLARGDHVVGVARTEVEPDGDWETVVWDASVGDAPAGVFDGCDAVVNVAGAPIAQRWTPNVWKEIVESRVDLTDRVAGAVARDSVPHLINGSAVGYYGATDTEVDESTPAGSGPLAELCTRWEAAVSPASQDAEITLLRTGIVLSTGGGAFPRMLRPARMGLGGPIGGGRQWMPWIHERDAVGMMLWCLDDRRGGPINLVAPGIVRQREFALALGATLGKPARFPTPAFAMKLMFGAGATVVLDGQRVRPGVAEREGYRFEFPDLTSALGDLVG